jgi:hypothetical protein
MLGTRPGTVPKDWESLDCPYLGTEVLTDVDDGVVGHSASTSAGRDLGILQKEGGLQTGGNHCHLLSNVSQVPILVCVCVCVRLPWQHAMSTEEE